MQQRLYALLSLVLRTPLESLEPASSPDTLESWDSLRHLQLVLAIEEEFGLQLTVDEIEAMQSVGSIVAIIRQHVEIEEERAQ